MYTLSCSLCAVPLFMYLDGTDVFSISSGDSSVDLCSLKQWNQFCQAIGLALQYVPKNVWAGKGRTTSFHFLHTHHTPPFGTSSVLEMLSESEGFCCSLEHVVIHLKEPSRWSWYIRNISFFPTLSNEHSCGCLYSTEPVWNSVTATACVPIFQGNFLPAVS